MSSPNTRMIVQFIREMEVAKMDCRYELLFKVPHYQQLKGQASAHVLLPKTKIQVQTKKHSDFDHLFILVINPVNNCLVTLRNFCLFVKCGDEDD